MTFDKSSKRIFVTGGTGMLGSYLLRHLLAKGYSDIIAIRRKDSRYDLVSDIKNNIRWVDCDLMEVCLLEELMQDRQWVFHCAGLVSYHPGDKKLLFTINGEGTANIVNNCLQTGVEKLVHISSTSTLSRKQENALINESAIWEPGKNHSAYTISKFIAEQEVWRGIAEGLHAVILNPSKMFGAGRWTGPNKFFKLAWKNYPYYSKGTTGVVDVRDVARLAVIAAEQNIEDHRIIANAQNISYCQLMSQIALLLQKKPPTIKVNTTFQELIWRLEWMRSAFTGARPLLTRETARQSAKEYQYDNSKSIQLLQFSYTPFQHTLQETAALFLESVTKEFGAFQALPL